MAHPVTAPIQQETNALAALLAKHVPAIQTGRVVVKGVVGVPHVRWKVAVEALDPAEDPLGACAGRRGLHARTLKEQVGALVQFVQWHPDAATFIAAAFHPIPVKRVTLYRSSHLGMVAVAQVYLRQAIGSGGINARLISALTGWEVVVQPAGPAVPAIPPLDESAS